MDDVFCYGNVQVVCNYPIIRVRTNKIYQYVKTRMIFDHLDFHARTNKRYEERAVFLDISCTGFRSTIVCIGYFLHSNLTFLIFITIDMRGSMKLVQAKNFIVH